MVVLCCVVLCFERNEEFFKITLITVLGTNKSQNRNISQYLPLFGNKN